MESMKALLIKYDAEGHFNPENMVLFGYSFPDWSINEMIENLHPQRWREEFKKSTSP